MYPGISAVLGTQACIVAKAEADGRNQEIGSECFNDNDVESKSGDEGYRINMIRERVLRGGVANRVVNGDEGSR